MTARRHHARRDDERGSLVVAVMIAAVVSLVVIASLGTALSSLDTTEHAGSSASALELADAGVNQAVREADQGGTGSPVTVSVAGAGTYSYAFTAAGTQPPSWHITAVGTDRGGAQRKIEADAVTQSLFPAALFANTGLHLPAGIAVDSFTDGATAADMCTGQGIIATDDVGSMSFGDQGGGAGVVNCSGSYPVDGCVIYDDPNDTPPPSGSGQCPPTSISYQPGPEPADNGWKPQPTSPDHSGGQLVCDAPLAAGTYVYQSLLVQPGCSMSGGEVDIWVSAGVQIGRGGNVGAINPPSSCSAYTGTDVFGNPASYYCPGWDGDLQIYSSGNRVTLDGNHIDFWGVIDAPNAVLSTNGPQDSLWGALAVGSTSQDSTAGSTLGSQFSLHYDQTLDTIPSDRVDLEHWREEACAPGCAP